MNVQHTDPARPLSLDVDTPLDYQREGRTTGRISKDHEKRIIRKMAWRIMWFLCAVYFFAMMDRLNIAFAALSMNHDLGFDARMFGIAIGIMYVSYGLFGLPTNLALERFGARLVISCITIAWGIAASAMGLVTDQKSFLLLRLVLGAAEAGLVPGVMVYLSTWFPAAYRARFNAIFILAAPISSIVTAILSTAILQMDNVFGIAGWRWLFLIEGSPAIVLGIVGLCYLSNKPKDAKWLTEEERTWLDASLTAEQRIEDKKRPMPGLISIIFSPMVLIFSLINFCLFCGLVTASSWFPTMLSEMGVPKLRIGALSAIVSLLCVAGMFLISRSSDRSKERIWHAIFALCLACAGFAVAALATQTALLVLGFLMATLGCYAAQSIFWTIPQGYFSRQAAPAAIGMLSTVASIGSGVMPLVVGALRTSTHSFAPGLIVTSGILLLAACLMLLTRQRIRAASVQL